MSIGREVRLLFRVEGEGRRIPVAVSVETGKNRYVEATRGAKGRYTAQRTRVPLTRPVPLTELVLGNEGHKVTVRRNDTLGGILLRHGVDGPTVDAIVRALRSSFDPRDLMPGHAVTIAAGRDAGGAPVLNAVALHLDDDEAVAVVRTEDGGFAAQRTTGTALRTAALAPAPVAAPAPEDTATPPRKPVAKASEAGPAEADQPNAADQTYEGPEHPVEPELVELRRTLRSGSTLMDLLLDADVRRPEADALVQSLRRVFNPRRLPAGITVRITKRPVPGFEPRIAWLDIELPKGRRIVVEREEKGRFSSRIANQPPPTPATQPPRGGRGGHTGARCQRPRSEGGASCRRGAATVGHTHHGAIGRYPDGHPATAGDRPRGGGSRHSGGPQPVQLAAAQDRAGNHAGDGHRRDRARTPSRRSRCALATAATSRYRARPTTTSKPSGWTGSRSWRPRLSGTLRRAPRRMPRRGASRRTRETAGT